MKNTKVKKNQAYRRESLPSHLWKNRTLVLMALPVVILLFMFNYVPMIGSIVAFKKFNYQDGIFGSPWCGLDNFKFLFNMPSLTWRMLRNTVGYYILFTVIGTVASVALAIALNECKKKYFARASQTILILPTFISFVAVSYIGECFLNSNGLLNSILQSWGMDTISWYQDPKYWPAILTLVDTWKGTGYASIIYLSALAGMDQEMLEAAALDGASKWQQIRYITMPMLKSMISIVTLMGLGGIVSSNTGLFYTFTQNSSMIYEATQTIDTYVLNAILSSGGNFGPSSSVSFFQSVVGCTTVIVVNMIVRKRSPESALF